MRLELPDGQWAELRERLTYGQAREIRRAFVTANNDQAALADLDMALVRAYVERWHVIGLSGEAVTLDDIEAAPDDIVQPLSRAALDLFNASAIPKAGAGNSEATRPVEASS